MGLYDSDKKYITAIIDTPGTHRSILTVMAYSHWLTLRPKPGQELGPAQ